jgi:DNA-binding NtrC family response regulator
MEHAFIMETGSLISLESLPQSLLDKTGTKMPNYLRSALEENESKQQLEEKDNCLATEDGADFTAGPELQSQKVQIPPVFSSSLDFEGDEEVDEGEESLGPADTSLGLDFNAQKEAFEKDFIIKALRTFKGRINQTALHANIPKKTLLRKIEKYGINAKDYS